MIVTGLLAVCITVAGLVLAFRQLHPSTRPNVLLITIDTLRADHVGVYGDRDASTPAIDALAARGARFVEAICQVPLTLPSHASMLTGLTPPAHAIRDNVGFALGRNVPTVAEQFRTAGYATAAFVSGYPLHHRFGLDRGFDLYDDRFAHGDDPARPPYMERRADATVRAASAWLAQADRTGTPARPFFAWVHLFDPHAPYEPPEPYRTRFRERPYDGEIAFADAQIGVLLDDLARRGLLGNTIVLVVSDHGEGLGEHGEPTHGLFIYDSTIRIPLVLAGPGVRSGLRATALARAIDVGPTLVDLAGVPALRGAEGRSLKPAAQGREMAAEDAYAESLFARLSFGWAPLHGWRSGRMMFIDAPKPELYDVAADPSQSRDLSAARPTDAARFQRLVWAVASKAAAVQPRSAGAEADERLRSLGYTGGAGSMANPSLRDPKDFAALAVRIEKATTIERTDPATAVGQFRAALKEDPTNPLARRHLAIALSNLRRFDEALAEARQLVAAGDTSADLLVLVGECYRLSGRPVEALDAFGQAAVRDPLLADPIDGRGRTLVAMGRRDEARQAFEAALALAPDDRDALVGLADLGIERGDLAEAQSRLEALRARERDDPAVAIKLGVVLVRRNDLDRAIALFEEALAIQPGNMDAMVDLGGALAKAGRPAEAVPYFEQAIASGARSPVVWNSLGFARLESGNPAGAADALRQSLRAQPGQPRIVEALRQIERDRR